MENGISDIYLVWEEDKVHGIAGTERQVTFNELASSIVNLGPFYYYVVDFTDMSLSNIHSALPEILGLDTEKLQFGDILEAIHPDDVNLVAQMERTCGQFFFHNIPQEKYLRYKSSYNFRMRLKDGKYALFNHQALLLTLAPDGGFGKAINIHTRIDHLTETNNHCFSIIGLDGEPSFLNNPLEEAPKQLMRFSAKEIEVIRHLSEGLDSEDIAGCMFISPHTVKQHRKNILEKSGCRNVAQLIKMCVLQGLV